VFRGGAQIIDGSYQETQDQPSGQEKYYLPLFHIAPQPFCVAAFTPANKYTRGFYQLQWQECGYIMLVERNFCSNTSYSYGVSKFLKFFLACLKHFFKFLFYNYPRKKG
jgi:hypothetical protein